MSKERKHELLDQDLSLYLKEALNAYDKLAKDFFFHLKFIKFWFRCIQKKPSAHNAVLCAFRFYDSSNVIAKEDKFVKDYLDKLKKHYNKQCNPEKPKSITEEKWAKHPTVREYKHGISIAQWIRSFQSQNPQKKILAKIDWLPKIEGNNWNKQEKFLADEFSFAWCIGRLWQLLKERGLERYIINFLGLNETQMSKNVITDNRTEMMPTELKAALTNQEVEKNDFFKRYLSYYSPKYMTEQEMCVFFKKACFSSIKDKSISNANKDPLDKIWLLGRFFRIHFYGSDFIKAQRGVSPRAAKQFVTTQNPVFLSEILHKDISKLREKYGKWGDKGIPVEEVFCTLADKNGIEQLKNKANEVFEEFEKNEALELLRKVEATETHSEILSKISFVISEKDSDKKKEAKERIVKMVEENPALFITVYLVVASMDYWWTLILKEQEDILENIDEEILPAGFLSMFIFSTISWAVRHEKNLFLITSDDVNPSFGSILIICFVLVIIWKLLQDTSVIGKSAV